MPEKGKTKQLQAAYQVAAEGHDLEFFKNLLNDHAAALQADIDAKEAKEAEKAAKSDKKKRKSEAKVDHEDVEMEDAEPAPKKSSKKRKKEADSDDEESEKVSVTIWSLHRVLILITACKDPQNHQNQVDHQQDSKDRGKETQREGKQSKI